MVSNFDDFDKTAKDLLKKDFDTETLQLKIKSKGPEELTINTNVDFFSASSLVAKVSCDKKFPQFTLDKLEHKNGSTTVETTIDDVIPNLSLSLNGIRKSDKLSGELSGTYTLPQATITGEIDVIKLQSIKASICTGTSGVTLGGDVTLESGALSDYSVGAGYTLPKQAFLGVRANKKLSDITANCMYTVNPDVTILGSYTSKAVCFGATYKCNPKTALKFKLDNGGNLATSAKHTLEGKTTITAAAAANIYDLGKYKVGVIASLG